MRITELLQRPGGWQMSLRPDTPQDVLDAIRAALAVYDTTDERWESVMDGQIVVFDTETQNPSLATARYTGLLETQTDTMSFAGPGLAALLATDDGIGFLSSPATGSSTAVQSLSDVIGVLISGEGYGLTNGTDYTPGGGVTTVEDGTPSPLTNRERIDAFATGFGQEWRVNPDGTVDAGEPADGLFVTDPVVLVDSEEGGEFGAIRRINGWASSPVIDCSQVTSLTIAYPANASAPESASAAGTVARGINGTAWKRYRAVDAPETEEGAKAATVAQSTQNLFEYPRSSFTVTSGDAHVRRFVQPGDSVYAYFPLAGIESDHRLDIGAKPVFPQKVRVQSIDWGVHPGHGVWLRRHNGVTETWKELTNWVMFADSISTWTVGTARGLLDAAALKGPARLGSGELKDPPYVPYTYTDPSQSVLPNESPTNPIPRQIDGPATAVVPAVRAPTYATARRG